MSVKRIDRTKQLMGNLEKAASQAVKEAAIMLKVIAREMVSRPYTKSAKQKKYDDRGMHWDPRTQRIEANIAKALARRRFTRQRSLMWEVIREANAKG